MASFSVEAMVRGYHFYKDIWATVVGEELPCQREDGNRADPFAAAVVKEEAMVGHVPKKISSVCSLYLRQGGSIVCRVAGSRRFSGDLVQGGLEIPCVLVFEGDAKQTALFASFITKGLTDEDKRPLGSGRASRGCKYRYNAISFTLCARIKILTS